MQVNYNNIKITSIESFGKIFGEVMNGCKNVCFVRCIGAITSYSESILSLDKTLSLNNNCKYLRIDKLPIIKDPYDIEYYSKKYNEWINHKNNILLKNITDTKTNSDFAEACSVVCQLFKLESPRYNPTIEKNFMAHLMWWTDLLLSEMLGNGNIFGKFVYYGKISVREYLFCYLATIMGIDVMLLLPSEDINLSKVLSDKSYAFKIGSFSNMCIPEYNKDISKQSEKNKKISIIRPEHYKSHRAIIECNNTSQINSITTHIETKTELGVNSNLSIRNEMPFEDLAILASSVVMITIHNDRGDIIGSGSGISIGSNGYILTNYHVVSNGKSFSVQIENDSHKYHTYSIIKSHYLMDLAIIKIDRQLNPLKIYSLDKKLVRGQKVVAIGSPLGLFNTVSDGIISAFRNMDNMDMIQFTAPISKGSSGGAVLNMYGEVIGISTAGITGGQNINLAISYEHIVPFISGF